MLPAGRRYLSQRSHFHLSAHTVSSVKAKAKAKASLIRNIKLALRQYLTQSSQRNQDKSNQIKYPLPKVPYLIYLFFPQRLRFFFFCSSLPAFTFEKRKTFPSTLYLL